nr:hypothetical protein [Methylibium sp. T29-B]
MCGARRQGGSPARAGRARPAGPGRRPAAAGEGERDVAAPRPEARTQAADARHVAAWWDGRPYDAILLDAPCSASGIVRRHPDVRWLRRASDLDALASTQAALLDALWPLLRPGGRLLYATCSVFKAEGAHQIDAFCNAHPMPSRSLHPATCCRWSTIPDR